MQGPARLPARLPLWRRVGPRPQPFPIPGQGLGHGVEDAEQVDHHLPALRLDGYPAESQDRGLAAVLNGPKKIGGLTVGEDALSPVAHI